MMVIKMKDFIFSIINVVSATLLVFSVTLVVMNVGLPYMPALVIFVAFGWAMPIIYATEISCYICRKIKGD